MAASGGPLSVLQKMFKIDETGQLSEGQLQLSTGLIRATAEINACFPSLDQSNKTFTVVIYYSV
jgi:hypothetical protein